MKRLAYFIVPALIVCAFIAGCNSKSPSEGSAAETASGTVAPKQEMAIAYIDFDSLIANYDMYKDMSTEFQKKGTRAESDINAKGKSLERDLMNYQERVQKGLLTRAQAQEVEAELTKKQQEFMQHRETAVAQLAEEEAVMLNQIRYSIDEYAKKFNSDGRYTMILMTNSSGPILTADSSLDITKEMLKGLNEAYAAGQVKK